MGQNVGGILFAVYLSGQQTNTCHKMKTITIITAQSWNRTDFIFNTRDGIWQMMDNVSIDDRHEATTEDLDAAHYAAKAERATFGNTIALDTFEII